MPALYLTEDDVRRVLTMPVAIRAVEEAFRQLAAGKAMNVPRTRARAPGIWLHTMSAAAEYLGLVGWKAYTTTKQGYRFHVALYDAAGGEMLALIEADHLGRIRTGAASGVATEYMARPDATEVGVFGTGRQARTQLEAVCEVRDVKQVWTYSPTEEHRRRFAEEMSEQLGVAITPVNLPDFAAEDRDIIITATNSRVPVFDGRLLAEGTHLNVIGSNFLNKAEVDRVTVRMCDTVVCDSVEQCKIEAGDFVEALEEGELHWSRVYELDEVVAGRQTGRPTPESITLFKSTGLAIEDVAVAAKVLDAARAEGLGRPLPG